MGQRVTCPCYSRPSGGMPPGQEIVTPSTLWQDIGSNGLPSACDGHQGSDITPPVARKLFEAPILPLSPKSDPSVALSQQDTSARSSPLVSSLFDDSPDKDTQASEPIVESHTPRAGPKGSASSNGCESSDERITAPVSNTINRPPGFCWVVIDKYGQRGEWLPKGYQRIQREGLVAKVRERLLRNGSNELNNKLEDQRIVRYLLGNSCDVEKVAELLEQFGKWCEGYGIAEIRKRTAEVPVDTFPYFKEVSKVFPLKPIAFETYLGYPVGIYRIGHAKMESLQRLDQAKVVEMVRYINECLDGFVFAKTEQTKLIIGAIQIFDFKGIKSYNIVKLMLHNLLKPVFQESSKYYVEEQYHTFLVNVPRIFLPLWYVIRLWLNRRMESKVTVSSNVPEALYDMIAKGKVPRFLGGDCEDDYGLGRE